MTALLASMPTEVRIIEVSPRDGLQNEPNVVPLATKERLIRALAGAGLSHIEATSFVSPKWVPQLADGADLLSLLGAIEGVTLSGLLPNRKGLERAVQAGLTHVAVFMSASESHNLKNRNQNIEASLSELRELLTDGRGRGLKIRGYLSTAFGCPYEGAVPIKQVIRLTEALLAFGCHEVSLGDTVGAGTPMLVDDLLEAARTSIPFERLALHMHDTRGTALANVLVGLAKGIRNFDTSVGGLGGCPYAPGASGNLATEDLVAMLDAMGVRTGVDLTRLLAAVKVAEEAVGRPLRTKVALAGPFVPRGRVTS